MIEPVCRGAALLQEIQSTEPACLAVWWLGQSGYLFKSPAGNMVVDPYLSEHLTTKYAHTDRPHVRMTAAPIRGADLTAVDVVLATHKHSDHLDPGTVPDLMAASPRARLVLPAALLDHARNLGLPTDRLEGMEAGDVRAHAGFTIRAIPSSHEALDTDALGRHLYLGFVIETAGLRLYHSGDSLAYDDLHDWLGPGPFDILFLPINGRDPARGVPGNMSAAEAVDLATRVRPRFVVPHHYDMFTFNTAPVESFLSEAARLPAGVRAQVLRCGERWEVEP
jgi:L-ascorbate metabolism protein UlaG (beta-lactamase superfamily)